MKLAQVQSSLFLLILLSSFLYSDQGFSILNKATLLKAECAFKERISFQPILEDARITAPRHIKTLLEDSRFEERYFLKAIVLDYLYKNGNAHKYYEAAFSKSDLKTKPEKGIYYAYYLVRINEPLEAIKTLRHIEVFASKINFYPETIGKIALLFGLDKDPSILAYLRIKKIDLTLLKEELNACKEKQ